MSDRLSIVVLPDGPLKLTGARSVTFGGEPLSVGEDVYLCRCGESKNAPFCDGSHKTNGFSGACEIDEKHEVKVWEGRRLRTFFNPDACMHVFYCKPLGALREAELAGDDDAGAEIARVVGQCPSGALSWEAKAELPALEPGERADVAIQAGGEVRVQCAYEINEPLHERQAEDRATLCRCGLSKNKPWCDGRHRKRRDWR